MQCRGIACAVVASTTLWLSASSLGEISLASGPVQFQNGFVSGTIELVDVAPGIPDGATPLEGDTADTDDSVVLRVTVSSGSIRRFGVGAWSPAAGGVYSNGTGTFPTDDGADVSMFDAFSGPTWRVFQFDEGGMLGAGETSDRLYVAFDGDALAAGDLLNFSLTPGNGMGGTFGVNAELDDVAAASCPEDTNGDGEVNVLDVTAVVMDWGTDGSANNGDVVPDGRVNVLDLVMVVQGYGVCE